MLIEDVNEVKAELKEGALAVSVSNENMWNIPLGTWRCGESPS